MLTGRRVVVGVSGGVAAYKSALLVRLLTEAGGDVRTVMTRSAARFLGPQTLGALTGHQPVIELFDVDDVSPHTTLGRWAELVVIAPATAATLARIAGGLSDDALSATVLATAAPLVVAPAMHTEMWEHPSTRRNLATLRADGHTVVEPETGALAGGDHGMGRMAEPETIFDAVVGRLAATRSLHGRRVLVSAGGTREPIDPVRFLGNRSSGKMGTAIAVEAARRGADVVLVTTATPPSHPGIESVEVETAAEMAEAVWARAGDCDVAVLAAAVADFRPGEPAEHKLRRASGPPEIELVPTADILAGVVTRHPEVFVVGFAAETDGVEGAITKAKEKGVDLLVANDVSAEGSGFGSDTNQVTLVLPDGTSDPWPVLAKSTVAARLWDRIVELREPPS